MTDSSPSFGSTITSGIQDITAILPLLGTEQCERHTETGLSKGFMYTAVTPISIFGSLGIVKAGASILILAIPPGRRFWGAKFLAHAGFKLEGAVAPMIACDPKISTKFLAESEFDKLLENEHVEDVKGLQIHWEDKSWNVYMALSTFAISSLGFIPYIYIILRSESPHQSPLLPLFPAARIIGSMLTCVLVQIIIQIRILDIIKSRLIFMHTDHYIRNSLEKDERTLFTEGLPLWHANQASELCLQELQRFLDTRIPKSRSASNGIYEWAASFKLFSRFKGLPTSRPQRAPARQGTRSETSYVNIDERESDTWLSLRRQLSETGEIYFSESKIWTVTRVLILPLLMAFALLLSIAGYIGIFNFVQKSSDKGPIFWLLFEGLLCLFRIAVWGWNPAWDDNRGLKISFVKTTRSPLVTTTLSIDDLIQSSTSEKSQVHLIRPKDFLGEISFHSWALPTFSSDDATLYYFLAVSPPPKRGLRTKMCKVLCILLCDYEERTSRLIFKNPGENQFKYLIPADSQRHGTRGALVTTLDLRNACPPDADTNALLSNTLFLEQLTKHYDTIVNRMNKANKSKVNLSATWVLQTVKHETDNTRNLNPVELTAADMSYIYFREFEAQRNVRAIQLGTWMQEYLKACAKIILCGIPTDILEPIKSAEWLEVMHLVTTVAAVLEKQLLSMFIHWEHVDVKYTAMMSNVMRYFDSGVSRSLEGKTKYTNKLKERLSDEKEQRVERTRKTDSDNMEKRIRSEEMEDLIQAARPADTTDGSKYAAIIDCWRQNVGVNDDWAAYSQGRRTKDLTSKSSPIDGFAKFMSDMGKRLSDKPQALERCRLRANEWQMFFKSTIAPYLSFYSPIHHDSGIHTWRTELEDGHEFSSTIAKGHAHGMDRTKHISLVVSNSLIECLGNLESIIALIKWFAIPVLYFDFNTPVVATEDLSKYDKLREFRVDNQDIKLSDLDLAIYQILKHCSRVPDIHFSDKNYSVPKLLTETLKQHESDILWEPGFQYIVRFEDVDFSNHQGSLFQSHIKLKKSDSSKCTLAACDYWSTETYALSLTYRLTMADKTKIKVIPISPDWQSEGNSGKSEVHREFAISVHVEQAGYRIQRLNIHIKLHSNSDEIYLLNIDLKESSTN